MQQNEVSHSCAIYSKWNCGIMGAWNGDGPFFKLLNGLLICEVVQVTELQTIKFCSSKAGPFQTFLWHFLSAIAKIKTRNASKPVIAFRLQVQRAVASHLSCMFCEPSLIIVQCYQGTMQGAMQAIRSRGHVLKHAVLQHVRVLNPALQPVIFSRPESATSTRLEEQGFESTKVADILKSKGKNADGSWLWCTTDDSVYDAVKSVCFRAHLISAYLSRHMNYLSEETLRGRWCIR